MATLLETWRNLAYGDGLDDKKREDLWTGYFTVEKGIYEKILSDPAQVDRSAHHDRIFRRHQRELKGI